MDLVVLPLHLGPMHPVEQALTLLLAFGPFVVLAAVIVVRRRADAADDRAEQDQTDTADAEPSGPSEPSQRER